MALRGVLALLRPGGVVTVLCYRGHDGGPEEAAAVAEFLSDLPPGFTSETHESGTNRRDAPVLQIVRRMP